MILQIFTLTLFVFYFSVAAYLTYKEIQNGTNALNTLIKAIIWGVLLQGATALILYKTNLIF